MKIINNKSLKNYNTCNIEVSCNHFIELNNDKDFIDFIHYYPNTKLPIYFLGLGANTLFTRDFKGSIVHINNKGIDPISEDNDYVIIKVQAGEIWDDFVNYCVKNNYYGAENLVSIPSTVGATPIQNIGAYGSEAKDIIFEVVYYDLKKLSLKVLSNAECNFSYRNSIFKQDLKNNFLIKEVLYKLSKKPSFNLTYGAIESELKKKGINEPKLPDIVNIISNIRNNKLPDYTKNGNAGSFFKNPIISINKFNKLKLSYPEIVSYPINENHIKIAAAWLIDNADLKSFSIGGASVHNKQALVLINQNKASGEDFKNLSLHIQKIVKEKYGILLIPEVIIL